MKFLSLIKHNTNYELVKSDENNYLFKDIACENVFIKSLVLEPWGKKWVIVPSVSKNKPDSGGYPAKLMFKLFEYNPLLSKDVVKKSFYRRVFKGKFYYLGESELEYIVNIFICNSTLNNNEFIIYYFS